MLSVACDYCHNRFVFEKLHLFAYHRTSTSIGNDGWPNEAILYQDRPKLGFLYGPVACPVASISQLERPKWKCTRVYYPNLSRSRGRADRVVGEAGH